MANEIKIIGKVVLTRTYDWWQRVGDEIETGDPGPFDWVDACEMARIDLTREGSFCFRVTGVAGRHSEIKVGDYVCCNGYGSDVVFVRLSKAATVL
ncbi:MAG TPA: hypothetical protein VH682_21785 [Gemmataceae bacterium]|jgi:hypothetical protein